MTLVEDHGQQMHHLMSALAAWTWPLCFSKLQTDTLLSFSQVADGFCHISPYATLSLDALSALLAFWQAAVKMSTKFQTSAKEL